MAASPTILLQPFQINLPGGSPPITLSNAVSFQFNYSLGGGSFTIVVLKDSIVPPPLETVLTTPQGRQAIVKSVTTSISRQGLVTDISGILVPPYCQNWVFGALINTGGTPTGLPSNSLNKTLAAKLLSGQGAGVIFSLPGAPSAQFAGSVSGTVDWRARDFPTTQFFYRGPALQGVQQLAQSMLAEVVVRNDKVIVIEEGKVCGNVFNVPAGSNIVALSQEIRSPASTAKHFVIDPGLTAIQTIFPRAPIFDAAHAQQQASQTIRMGKPLRDLTTGGNSIPVMEIPDGWAIDGDFVDFDAIANPAAVPTSPGDFWKLFKPPGVSAGKGLRGITQWRRIIKDLQATNDVSSFVGTPAYQASNPNGPGPTTLRFGSYEALGPTGSSGFTMDEVTFFDVVSGTIQTIKKPLILTPPNGVSSQLLTPAVAGVPQYYEATFDLWFFPLLPAFTLPGVGVNPTNPYNIPSDTAIISPPSQILRFPLGYPGPDFYDYYLPQYKIIQGPRLKTVCSFVYRGQLPMPGDRLTVASAPNVDCGRIEAVSFSLSARNLSVTATAEVYDTAVPGSPFEARA